MSARLIVTIDGPAGVGKTTMAKKTAGALGIAYLDTGAMFRTLALRLGRGIENSGEKEIRTRAEELSFSLEGVGEKTALVCNGQVVGREIRTEEVGQMASRIAALPVIRDILKEAQRAMGKSTDLVVEGRDMGTVIFPKAACKFFLDAAPRVRAERRKADLEAMGATVDLDELEAQIVERDRRDRTRKVAPLKPAEDATVIDTSFMTREEVLSTILKAVSRSDRAKKAFAQGAYLGHFLERVREARPLVHFITNFVTVNDCANITLATGASPIMADAPEEMAEVTSICDALVINMGTLNARTAASMVAAGKAASKAGHVVVFDPVGAGVSALRNETAHNILQEVRPTLIRGNLSEIRYLALGLGGSHGVDAAQGDSVTIDNIHTHADMILHFARRQQCVVVASGPIDIVSDGRKVFCVHNGCSFMGRITGTGCMASGVLAAFAAAGRDRLFEAAVAATVCMGVAGEMAARRLKKGEGTGSFRTYLLDAVSCLKPRELDRQARLECLAPEKGGEGNVD